MSEEKHPSCCPPAAARGKRVTTESVAAAAATRQVAANAVQIPGGTAMIGTRSPQIKDDGESPLRKTKLRPFLMAATTVTNAQFKAFVDATGYVTEAEEFTWSFVFWAQIPGKQLTRGVKDLAWWRRVEGANWRDINGPDTQADSWNPEYPVVHMSWRDAQSYATWVGGRLPTEAEWEHAARGGLGDVKFPWGDREPDDAEYQPCNIWQGHFPEVNTAADGYVATAPAQSFEANGYGLYNMVGNAWQWTADDYRIASLKKQVKQRLAQMKGYKLSKGGSYLCHRSYCYRYRIAARSGTSPDSATTHQSFRVAWDEEGQRKR